MTEEKERPAIYRHLNKQEYECIILESTPTMHCVRLPEATARELKLATELWLPASYIRFTDEDQ
jgi:hypothetical protein